MANRKNHVRRNKKSNNWKTIMRIKNEKKKGKLMIDDHGNHPQPDIVQNDLGEIVARPVESSNLFENDIKYDEYDSDFDNPNISIKRKRSNDPVECTILPQENYFACLDEDDVDNDSFHSNQMSNTNEIQAVIDPLLCGDSGNNVDYNIEQEDVVYIEDLGEESDEDEYENADSEDELENEQTNIEENSEVKPSTQKSMKFLTDENASNDETEEVVLEEKVSGRRIFDIDELFKGIKRIGSHSRNCSFNDMVLISERKRGLNSTFKFQCVKCGVERNLESCPKKQNSMNCNEDAVLGITSIGSGYSHLKEVFTNLNVPVMGNTTYDKIQKTQQSDWESAARKSALDALYEEIEIAKALNLVDSHGNALITVIVDGGWGKRSYGKAFNSLSGCAVLIGLRTKKVIYYDTRNKYCHTCKIAESNVTPVKEHVCNINYKGPSSGMESDIITEGFKFCDEHGARFNQLVADGDSNTYKNLRDIRIYQNPDVFVEKFECVNHLHRNFRSKFAFLSTLTRFDSDLRKFIKPNKGNAICKGIKVASKHWRESNLGPFEKIAQLEDDIMNCPAHYFGVHDKCKSYFCSKTTEQAAIEQLNLLKEDGIYYEVLNLCQHYFANNAKSLLQNYTNNPAEEFNNLVAKYNGGKRINYSLAGSYSARVAAAVVQYNSGGHASSEFRKHKFGKSDNLNIKSLENQRKRKLISNEATRQTKPTRRIERREKEKNLKGAYYHGDGCEDQDMEPAIYEKAKNVLLEKLKTNQRIRKSVETSTRGGKFNSRWQQIRQDLLPSPFFSRIVKTKQRRSYKNILDELMYKRSEFGNGAAIKHQRLVERDALKIFENLFPWYSVKDCGIFIDAKNYFLCASPYKLCGKNHILTIKCPLKQYGKKFDDVINQIPFFKDNGKNLNKDNEWYIELQSELHITPRKSGFIMVWLGEVEGEPQYRVVEIPRDDKFFEDTVKPNLVYFYEEVMMKELVDSRIKRNMPLREYDSEKKLFI